MGVITLGNSHVSFTNFTATRSLDAGLVITSCTELDYATFIIFFPDVHILPRVQSNKFETMLENALPYLKLCQQCRLTHLLDSCSFIFYHFHSYVSAVDKALKNFEYTSEWADLISALGKLNKVLLSHMKFPVIPRRIKISKRLAQCMHPALPSGVHLKALETYDIIFKCMGTNRLSHELFIYSAGKLGENRLYSTLFLSAINPLD